MLRPDPASIYEQAYQDMPDWDLPGLYTDLEKIKGNELTLKMKALLRGFLTGNKRLEVARQMNMIMPPETEKRRVAAAATVGAAWSETLYPHLRTLLAIDQMIETFPRDSARTELRKRYPAREIFQEASPIESIELSIGLSEASQPIANFLKHVERVLHAFQLEESSRIRFDIHTVSIESARDEFKRPNKYDILIVDDPWIPGYCAEEIIRPLSEESLRQIKSGGFNEIFIESLHQVCHYENQLIGLPIIGNVQMLIQRSDTYSDDIPTDVSARLTALEALPNRGLHPLVRRADTDNEVIQAFWEILRALGHRDNPQADRVIINRAQAIQAASWMRDHTIPRRFSDIQSELIAPKKSQMAVSLGWPGWMIGQTTDNNYLFRESDNIRFELLANPPLMGAWILALPQSTKHCEPQLMEYSNKVIHALTTNLEFQFLLAQQGIAPVLKEFTKTTDIKKIPFWHRNYDPIRQALILSQPRPRLIDWPGFECGLASQVRQNISNDIPFTDIPNLLTFE
jgi:hypothetical protein